MSGWASVPHFRQTKKTEEVVMEGTGHVAGAGNHPGRRDLNVVVGVTHGSFIRRYSWKGQKKLQSGCIDCFRIS